MTTQTVPIITLRMLRGACKPQRAIFKSEWPSGAEATLENVLRAVELGLDLEWGRRLFSPTARAEYDRRAAGLRAEYEQRDAWLWAGYERQVTPFRAEYDRQWAALRAEYDRQWAALWDEYQRQKATLWDEHQRQIATLWDEYQRQIAPFWLAAFLASHGGVE